MAKFKAYKLTRRERQIIDIVYRLETASVHDVIDQMIDPPSYSAIRALMRLMEEKGYIKHKKQGAKYIYSPTQSRTNASKSAIKNLVNTFFDNSTEDAVAALLDSSEIKLSENEMKRISKIISAKKK
jgi:BlaI family transcriptional regulator, penicillinase repressor